MFLRKTKSKELHLSDLAPRPWRPISITPPRHGGESLTLHIKAKVSTLPRSQSQVHRGAVRPRHRDWWWADLGLSSQQPCS